MLPLRTEWYGLDSFHSKGELQIKNVHFLLDLILIRDKCCDVRLSVQSHAMAVNSLQ